MAKSGKRTGLGRGLNSLMGESLEEISAQDSDVKATSTESNSTVSPDERPVPKEAEMSVAGTRAAEDTESIDESSTGDAAAETPSIYIEEDDHVEIHGVVERAAKAADEVPLAKIVPNPDQPRTLFKQDEIEELATSIEKEGLLQPIVVREVDDMYQIIAGERRWQACRTLGLRNVPVRIVQATDDKAIELALVENVQRSDLNPIEEAYGYKRLMERQGMTQSDVARAVSKGRSTIANALRLLELPEDAQQLLFEEKITAGHARAILSIPTEEGRKKLTERLKSAQLSVREAENLARLFASGGTAKKEGTPREAGPSSFKKVAQELRDKLKTNVRVKTARGKNKIEIEFNDETELKRLFKQIAGE